MQKREKYNNLDIAGKKYGRLTAIEKVGMSTWKFHCDCGTDVILKYSRVLYGQKSCGCLRKEMFVKWAESHTKHGQSKTKLYRKYKSILNRCYNTNNRQYKRYGGRGIDVCEEWKNSFEAFRDWAYSNGYDPQKDGHYWSVDRIDNNKGYSPKNCRFTTAKEQMRNREITSLHDFCGCLYSASEFADLFGITDKSFVYRRLQKGETLKYILNDWTRMHKIPDYLMEVETYAEEKNVTPASVRRWINQGKIKGEKVGRKWYVYKQQ